MLAIYYGNCQVVNLNKFLKLEKSGYDVKTIDCTKTKWDINKLKRFLNRAKLIIMTYIRPNYRNRYYLSSHFIVNNTKLSTKIIIIPSIYFPVYHYDAMTIKLSEYDMLQDPEIHHYRNLMNCYLKKKSVGYYMEKYPNNTNLFSNQDLELMVKESISQICIRQNEILSLNRIRPINVILIDNFIKDNFRDKILFHTYHHPTTILYEYIIDQIVNFISVNKRKISWDQDPLKVYGKMYIYECMKKILNFNVDEYNEEVLERYNNDLYNMVRQYYSSYDKRDNKKYIEFYKEHKKKYD